MKVEWMSDSDMTHAKVTRGIIKKKVAMLRRVKRTRYYNVDGYSGSDDYWTWVFDTTGRETSRWISIWLESKRSEEIKNQQRLESNKLAQVEWFDADAVHVISGKLPVAKVIKGLAG